ncbi:MAG TPA: hypothetical protein VFI31_05180 [Pirellulales bacterium]|nr:hypothetical protein [Pirellulales bacterium]
MEAPTFTIYFRGGPLHGRSHTDRLTGGVTARIGQQYTVATEFNRGQISTIHEYEFTHVQGPMIVAQFMKTVTITDDRTQPSWGPWRNKLP